MKKAGWYLQEFIYFYNMKSKILLLTFFLVQYVYSQWDKNPCEEFNVLNTEVRDGMISRDDARNKIRELIPKIREYFFQNGGKEITDEDWVFPLQGYTSSSIGGVNGSGYQPKGYDYFDGNKHGGHPAHDIFIVDKNQDDLDDYSKSHVNILSITNGIVVACEPEWEPSSGLRGGKYIYVYDPAYDGLFYYAHNSEIFVKPGDIVSAGEVIAYCGRTGLNAYKKRSPTHLHLMFLQIDDGYPEPKDIYIELLNAKNE
jgi:peptidoglycan LD-endopeptidase LytH